MIRIRMCAYQGVRNVAFSENLRCFDFLKHPSWDSPFCLNTNDLVLSTTSFQNHLRDMITVTSKCSFLKQKNEFYKGTNKKPLSWITSKNQSGIHYFNVNYYQVSKSRINTSNKPNFAGFDLRIITYCWAKRHWGDNNKICFLVQCRDQGFNSAASKLSPPFQLACHPFENTTYLLPIPFLFHFCSA